MNSHFRIVSNPSKMLHSLAQPFLLVFPPKFSNLNHHPSFFPICLGSPHPDGTMSQSQLPKLFETREVCGGHGSHCGFSLFHSFLFTLFHTYLSTCLVLVTKLCADNKVMSKTDRAPAQPWCRCYEERPN